MEPDGEMWGVRPDALAVQVRVPQSLLEYQPRRSAVWENVVALVENSKLGPAVLPG